MEQNGYAYPNPATKRRAMIAMTATVIGVLVLGLVLHTLARPWIDQYFDTLEDLAKHDPVAAKRKLLGIIALIGALNASVAITAGTYFFSVGWRTVRAERWPFPGMKVYRRYRILTGRAARRRGTVFIVLGLVLAILGPALSWKMYAGISTALYRPRPNSTLQPTANLAFARRGHSPRALDR